MFFAAADLPPLVNFAVLLILLGLVGLSIWGCIRLARRVIAQQEGQLQIDAFGIPDLLTVGMLSLWLGGASMVAFIKLWNPSEPTPETANPVTDSGIIQSGAMFLIIVALLVAFLLWRKLPVARLIGLCRLSFFRAVGKGTGYLFLCYPMILFVSGITLYFLGEETQPQELLLFFRAAVEEDNLRRLLLVGFTAVIIAPITEEFIFRGYIYGTLRRYVGPAVAIGFSAVLFALIHVNVMALPALFLLAIILALAYEITGSLLVPITMHAIFNGLTLVNLYLASSYPS